MVSTARRRAGDEFDAELGLKAQHLWHRSQVLGGIARRYRIVGHRAKAGTGALTPDSIINTRHFVCRLWLSVPG
jgi:hypothetical protein